MSIDIIDHLFGRQLKDIFYAYENVGSSWDKFAEKYGKYVDNEWKLPSFTNAKLAICAERKRINTEDARKGRKWAGLDFETTFFTSRNGKCTPMTKEEHIAWTYRRICPESGGKTWWDMLNDDEGFCIDNDE